MRRISALATALTLGLTLGLSTQAALAGGFAFDLPRVDFPSATTTTLSTSGSLTPAPTGSGH